MLGITVSHVSEEDIAADNTSLHNDTVAFSLSYWNLLIHSGILLGRQAFWHNFSADQHCLDYYIDFWFGFVCWFFFFNLFNLKKLLPTIFFPHFALIAMLESITI